MSIYVCSDIHGQYKMFKEMLDKIGFSDDDELYIAGDIIDRGPDGIEMLKDVMNRKNVKCIIGNHELMMWTHYRYKTRDSFWSNPSNGGKATKKQFTSLPESEQEEILDFIEGMYVQIELEINGKKFLVSHTDFIPEKGTCLIQDTANYDHLFDLVWNSPWRFWEYAPESQYKEDGRIHVIGHVPVQYVKKGVDASTVYIDNENNIINIDMGCAWIGKKGVPHNNIALCMMNLTEYASGNPEDAFSYIYHKDFLAKS